MKKIVFLFLLAISSYAQTLTKPPWSVLGFTTPGMALGITSTVNTAFGPAGVVSMINVSTSSGSGISTITGSGGVVVTSISGGFNVSTSGTGSSVNTSTLLGIQQHYGYVYNKTSWPTTVDFTGNSITLSVTGANKIQVTGSSGSLDITGTKTVSEKSKVIVQYTIGAPGTATNGMAPAMRSVSSGNNLTIYAYCPITTVAGSGQVILNISGGNVTTATGIIGGGTISGISGDLIETSIEIDGTFLIAKSTNLSIPNSPVSTVMYDYITGGGSLPNLTIYSLIQQGGTNTIQSLIVQSNELRGAVITTGDSKQRHVGATYLSVNSYQGRINDYYKNKNAFLPIISEGGPGDYSADILARTTMTIAKMPRLVMFIPSSNDKRNAVPFATWAANTKATINAYTAAGISLLIGNMLPEGVIDYSGESAWVNTITGPGITIVGIFQEFKNAGDNLIIASLTGDNVHLNDNGHSKLADFMIRNGYFTSYLDYYSEPSYVPFSIGSGLIPNNIAIGLNGLSVNTSGTFNSTFGYNAGASNSAGIYNVFLGAYAGYRNNSGQYNVFGGQNAGLINTSGSFNVFLGPSAGAGNTTGQNSVYLGRNANLVSNCSGCVAIGNQPGAANAGTTNVLIGDRPATTATNSSNLVVIGGGAPGGSLGSDNTYVGNSTGINSGSGAIRNILLGSQAVGGGALSGTSNIFGGYQVAFNATSTDYDIVLGNASGANLTTGDNNLFIGGERAGYGCITCSGSMALGYNSGYYNNLPNIGNISNSRDFSTINWDMGIAQTVNLSPITVSGFTSAITTALGGALAARTYCYRLAALNNNGETNANTESCLVTTGTTSQNIITWPSISGATLYRLYVGTATGAQNIYYTTTGTSFIDAGISTTITGTPRAFNVAFGTVITPAATSISGLLFAGGLPVLKADMVNTATDADYSVTSSLQIVKLPVVTANRNLTLPSAAIYTGQQIRIWNQNTSGSFSWTFVSTVKDAANSNITTLVNSSWYILISDGTNWSKVN